MVANGRRDVQRSKERWRGEKEGWRETRRFERNISEDTEKRRWSNLKEGWTEMGGMVD